MYYVDYNDNELLYLVSEGSERALDLLCHKYNIYINKVIGKIKLPLYKKEDLVQECIITLIKCISRYNPDYNKSFFSYFNFIMYRKIYKLLNTSYYHSYPLLEDDCLPDNHGSCNSNIIGMYRRLLINHDEIDLLIFDECFVEGFSLTAFAKKYNLDYGKVYYKYKCIREELKKY